MFDFDIGKLIVFGIVALAVIPPKDLPRVMRTVGKYVGQMRRMAADFRGQFEAAIKEAEFESIKKEIDEINDAAKVDTSFDPAALMRDNIEKAAEDKPPHEENPTSYETVTVEPPAPPAEPVAVELPPVTEKAASSAT
jgi:sec-independent protein translocase protein TatB